MRAHTNLIIVRDLKCPPCDSTSFQSGRSFSQGSPDACQCLLVIIGKKLDGTKKLVAIGDGLRESKGSWLELLRDLKSRRLDLGPRLAVGDGAQGFLGALEDTYPETP